VQGKNYLIRTKRIILLGGQKPQHYQNKVFGLIQEETRPLGNFIQKALGVLGWFFFFCSSQIISSNWQFQAYKTELRAFQYQDDIFLNDIMRNHCPGFGWDRVNFSPSNCCVLDLV